MPPGAEADAIAPWRSAALALALGYSRSNQQTLNPEPTRSEGPTLATLAAQGRHNAFDALRLLLALLVVYTHARLLGGFGTDAVEHFSKGQSNAGAVAVMGFFGISGFLITRSFTLSGSAWRFVCSRLLRILPGFYFALLVTAFVLAPLIGHFNARGGPWSVAEALRFCAGNGLIRVGQWSVGGVLHGLPYNQSIDGSLWSLFPEVCCYGFVLFAGVFGLVRAPAASMLLVAATVGVLSAAALLAPEVIAAAPTFLRLTNWGPYVASFAVGAALFCARDHVPGGPKPGLFWCVLSLVVLHYGGWAIVGPLVLTMALVQLAFAGEVRLPADLSYGTYLLHFPVLQLLSALGANGRGFTLYLIGGVGLTLALASLSWFAVERPSLRLKSRSTSA